LCTCTAHSGAKKDHDWEVDQLADLVRTTHRVKTQRVVKSLGQHCGDIELPGYLANAAGPVLLVLDLRLSHDRFGSSSDPTLNGRLHYNDIDKSLNEDTNDKIRKYRADYNNNPPNTVAFMPAIAVSGVQSPQSNLGATCFHFRRAAVLNHLKSKCGLILAKAAALRVTLNLDGAPIASHSHTHPSHSQTSR
jgi:hypothetical protein